ncbi:MAG: hypothetical protein JJE04_00170 [Acidobacteriia bacterium]|nr:hypothetical protein [Terriglobia bacterium]
MFADATDCIRLLYWGILDKIVIKGKITEYNVKQMREFNDSHSPQDLFLENTGKRIAPNFIRPYAICKKPSFLA